jgi:hypothetical protein
MLVDDIGDVTITNDGATILKLLEIEHPAAKVCKKPGSGPLASDHHARATAAILRFRNPALLLRSVYCSGGSAWLHP